MAYLAAFPNARARGAAVTTHDAGGTRPGATDVDGQTYFEFQVEQPATEVPVSAGPRYPDILRAAGVNGEVLVQFVVDTAGRVAPDSFRILKSTHELFEQAVESIAPTLL